MWKIYYKWEWRGLSGESGYAFRATGAIDANVKAHQAFQRDFPGGLMRIVKAVPPGEMRRESHVEHLAKAEIHSACPQCRKY